MRVNSDPTGCRPSLGVDVLIAEGGIGPRPAGTHHQRLEVVLAGIADRDGAGVFPVVVDDESLGRQRTGIPVAIIARLYLRQRPPTTRLPRRDRSKNLRYRMRGLSRARRDRCTMAASGAPRVRKLGLRLQGPRPEYHRAFGLAFINQTPIPCAVRPPT